MIRSEDRGGGGRRKSGGRICRMASFQVFKHVLASQIRVDYDTFWHLLSLLKELLLNLFLTLPSIERYVPGIALLLGFSRQRDANAKQEVSASFVVASADSLDVKIKFPEVENIYSSSFFFFSMQTS